MMTEDEPAIAVSAAAISPPVQDSAVARVIPLAFISANKLRA
jgi:hypothetical protein